MTETKFTQGPWKFDGEETAYYDLPTLNIRDKDGDIVAGVVDYISDPGLPNTHLIAAAPDLYEALSVLVELSERLDFSEGYCCCGDDIDSHGIYSGHSPVDAGDYYSMGLINQARAALSKARGE